MDIAQNWESIKQHFNNCFKQNLHLAVASVDDQNCPTVIPVGSMFFDKTPSGFYFEKYISSIPKNAGTNKNICVLAVNTSKLFWLKSLFKEKFSSHPGLKLYGTVGQLRDATPKEIFRLNRRMKSTKGLKGNSYLWGDMARVRDVTFSKVEKINCGKMTQHL